MLFINVVKEIYHNNCTNRKHYFNESQLLIQKFIPVTLIIVISTMADGISAISSPEIIQISLCYTKFSDFKKAFRTVLKDI